MNSVRKSILSALLTTLILASISGCRDQTSQPTAFEPNYLFAYQKYQRDYKEEVITDPFLSDTKELLVEWFGSPDAPKLPPAFAEEDYTEFLSLEKMKPAVGPAIAGTAPGETGLYRQLCASCHGETGQGRGTVAASQNPYPRDFRKGLYKFKVTARSAKPLKSDLARTLRQGVAGSQMPLFDKLSDAQIDGLVEYVVYLSIRGEFERELLALVAEEEMDPKQATNPDPKKRQRVYDVSYRGSSVESQMKAFKGQVDTATDLLTGIADKWIGAKADVFAMPEGIPVPGLTDEKDIDPMALEESIKKGRELFVKQEAACAKCHGESAKGDGQLVPDYDDWTKEWTKQISIDPTNADAISPFLARGALKPQPLSPRNLLDGKLRGGRDPRAVYHRIIHGIAGSPMPSAAVASTPTEPGLQKNEIWHLVNYILSFKPTEPTVTAKQK